MRKTDESDFGVLNASQEKELAQYMGVSIEEVMAKKGKPCPLAAKKYARKLLPTAISAATKAAVLRRRGVLSHDAEDTIRQIVGEIGIFLGKGTFKSTFTSLMVLGDQDRILANFTEGPHSRRPTKKLLSELRDDLSCLNQGGEELERIIPKSSDNYLLETPYLSIACYVQGLSETAIIRTKQPDRPANPRYPA